MLEQSKGELFNGRDLSKKGSRRRQVEYAERMARKASEPNAVIRNCRKQIRSNFRSRPTFWLDRPAR